MENKNRLIDATAIITSFLCLCPMIYGIIMWNKLPELMPIHFDANGEPNNWGPRWVTVYFLPVFLAIINLVVNFSFYFKARQSGETVKSMVYSGNCTCYIFSGLFVLSWPDS